MYEKIEKNTIITSSTQNEKTGNRTGIVLLYDASDDGYFTAVFTAYQNKIKPRDILPAQGFQGALETEVLLITTDAQKSARVKEKLKQLSQYCYREILYALSSCEKNKGILTYNFIDFFLKTGADAIKVLGNDAVLKFNYLVNRVKIETHRFLGFIRFEQAQTGFLYSHYEPDNDITKFIMRHFFDRMGKTPFIIHDVKRNILGLSNGKRFAVFKNEEKLTVYLSDEEREMKKLWKTYYETVFIKERKNTKQMKSYMPVRYWKNLPEKN